MDNVEIARALAEVADVLEIQGANPFRIRAYRNAARTVEVQTTPLARLVASGSPLTALPGIGKEMAGHVQEMVATGTFAYRDELLAEVPRTLIELTRLPAVGPKKARRLFDELGIATVDALEEAARAGQIAGLAGFGDKSQEKILAGIADFRQHTDRMPLVDAERYVEPLIAYLRETPGIERVEAAGSYRRRRETVGDIDLLATAERPAAVIERFLAYPQIASVSLAGDTRATVLLGVGAGAGLGGSLQVDLRAVAPECYGAALVYFTGSKEHNIRLRRRGVERGLKISEYGVFRLAPAEVPDAISAVSGEEAAPSGPEPACVAGREEADVYAAVGLPWIPPELREDRGEIEAALAGRLPKLIETADLRGDLQMHSTWSDGRNTLEEMVAACAARGYKYMAITDHSKALAMVQGLDAARLRLQWAEIAGIRARHPEIRLLSSMEIDILADGTLDLEDEMIAGLDLVVVSIHSRFDLPAEQQTARILKALEHPEVDILAHPTGRIINRRKAMDFDVDAVLRAAAERGVAVELNAHPNRLDLKDDHLRLAKRLGCKIVLSTDSHRTSELDLMRCGVEQARRAGLAAGDVINTLPLADFLAALGRG